jgi:hypothetical protein
MPSGNPGHLQSLRIRRSWIRVQSGCNVVGAYTFQCCYCDLVYIFTCCVYLGVSKVTRLCEFSPIGLLLTNFEILGAVWSDSANFRHLVDCILLTIIQVALIHKRSTFSQKFHHRGIRSHFHHSMTPQAEMLPLDHSTKDLYIIFTTPPRIYIIIIIFFFLTAIKWNIKPPFVFLLSEAQP